MGTLGAGEGGKVSGPYGVGSTSCWPNGNSEQVGWYGRYNFKNSIIYDVIYDVIYDAIFAFLHAQWFHRCRCSCVSVRLGQLRAKAADTLLHCSGPVFLCPILDSSSQDGVLEDSGIAATRLLSGSCQFGGVWWGTCFRLLPGGTFAKFASSLRCSLQIFY